MVRSLSNIFWLGTKELRSLFGDVVLIGLVIYSFTVAVISQAQSSSQELHRASIAVVDEDNSELSRRIAAAFLPPYFQRPISITQREVEPLMNSGRFTFVLDIPPNFQRDVLAGRKPSVQVNVDATAMIQAGIGSGYALQIITTEVAWFVARSEVPVQAPVNLVTRIAFNPNITTAWFEGVMGIINSVTMLAIILAGAALVREREHGTMDHLLVMPLSPYLFFATAVGLFLGTIARSMPQLGLLYILVAVPMNLLSGAMTPVESQPVWLATIMQASPSTHFVSFAQSILYRGAGLDVVWPQFLAVAGIGALVLALTLRRFRAAIAAAGA